MTIESPAPATPATPDARSIGLIIGVASLLSILMMAHHPSIGSRDIADVAEEIARKATIDRIVHGSLIALLGVLLFGLDRFSARLPARSLAQAALIAFAIGTGAGMLAALISGFVVSGLGQHYAGAAQADLAALRPLLVFAMRLNQAAAALGVAATSLAIALWSLALLFGRTAVPAACFGIVLGVGSIVALLSGLLRLHVHGMLLVVVADALWYLAIAAALIRRRL